jgi:hypothetical protein
MMTRVKTLAPPRESPDQAASWSHPLPTPQVDTTLLYTGEILPHATVRMPCGSRSLARSSKGPRTVFRCLGAFVPVRRPLDHDDGEEGRGHFNGLRRNAHRSTRSRDGRPFTISMRTCIWRSCRPPGIDRSVEQVRRLIENSAIYLRF